MIEAENGPAALDLWNQYSFDCVLLDYQMQSMDGTELFEELSRRTPCSPIAAIFLTGHGNETLAMEVIGAGAFDFVSKEDLNPAVLRRAVQYALARKHHWQQLNRLANEDTLTGLANRAVLSTLLDQAIAGAQRSGQHVAVLFLDLDQFKAVNDTMGHAAGDCLLVEAARRLKQISRASDTVARFGGDEFAILTQLTDLEDNAGAFAERIIQGFDQPFDLDGHPWSLGVSIGIAVGPRDGATVDELLKSADLALYKAKAAPGSGYRFYTEGLNARVQQRRATEQALRTAHLNDEFELRYQPRVQPQTGQILGAEASVYWHSRERGTLPLADVQSVAEATGLTIPIGKWALRSACSQCAAWHAAGLSDLFVSLNLSAPQLLDGRIVETVRSALAEADLDPRYLEVEVTETAAMDQKDTAAEPLHGLADLGVRIAIDDFGTGYSSLARLTDLPVHKLKTDATLISSRKAGSAGGPSFVDLAVSLGQHLDLQVVADGVEDAATLAYSGRAGSHEVQGTYLSRPLHAAMFRDWCDNWREAADGTVAHKVVAACRLPQTA